MLFISYYKIIELSLVTKSFFERSFYLLIIKIFIHIVKNIFLKYKKYFYNQ